MVDSMKSFLKVDEHPTGKKSSVHIGTDGFYHVKYSMLS